jgi:ribosomal protein S18 acetylase RimI-like enzyme
MSVKIDTATQNDIEDIDTLWREAFVGDEPRHRAAAAVPLKLAFQPDLFLVAREDGTLIGSVMAGYDGYRGHIYRVAVRVSHRRQGIGVLLMHAAEDRLRALGCIKINLQVRAENSAVADFYRNLGYEIETHTDMSKAIS